MVVIAGRPVLSAALARYRVTHNPATGERIQYVVTGLESEGTLVRYRWTSDPGGAIVAHTHPGSTETFTILDGEATFEIEGVSVVLRPGQTAVVPPGAVHSEKNASASIVRGIVELAPAAMTAELHDALAGISTDLPHGPTGAPKNPLQLGATFWYFRNDLRAISPPVWLQNLFLPVLAGLAKLAGVPPVRPQWESRLAEQTDEWAPLFDEHHYPEALEGAGYTFDLSEPRRLTSP